MDENNERYFLDGMPDVKCNCNDGKGLQLGTDEKTELIDALMADYPHLLSCNQTAGILNISRASVYRLMDTGELERIRIHLSADSRPTTRITNKSVRNLLVSWSTPS